MLPFREYIFLPLPSNLFRYFGVDIGAIQDYSLQFKDIMHCRAEIRYPNSRYFFLEV